MNRLTYIRSLELLIRTILYKEIRNRYPTVPRDGQNCREHAKISKQMGLRVNYLTPQRVGDTTLTDMGGAFTLIYTSHDGAESEYVRRFLVTDNFLERISSRSFSYMPAIRNAPLGDSS